MKTIIIACGTGVASSGIMNRAITQILKKNSVPANVIQCRLSQIGRYINGADFVVSTIDMQKDMGKPVILGTGFLTGVGVEALEAEILKRLA